MDITEFTIDLLEDDPSGHGRSKLNEELFEMKETLKRKFDQGVSPEEAKKIAVIQEAIDAADMIVNETWESKNN